MERNFAKYLIVAVACIVSMHASGIDVSNRYRSPRNPERKVRSATELIVLHTTEAPARSSLNKVSDRGECHFCVTEDGTVYRIVDRDREAFHAGRSMWNGKEDVDQFSIGIECVGYHNKPMGMVQLRAIKDLVKELKNMYNLSDERVVAHSHVAYGAPNKWQRRRHRGRKRCGMLFAMASVRRVLELKSRPAYDRDTRAGRLVVADDYLNKVLYGNVDTMVAAYGGVKPSTPVRVAYKGQSKKPVVAKAVDSKGKSPTSITDLKSRGYTLRGTVTKDNTAMRIAGARWNAADTYYVIRNKIIPGNVLNPAKIEKGMGVWMKK